MSPQDFESTDRREIRRSREDLARSQRNRLRTDDILASVSTSAAAIVTRGEKNGYVEAFRRLIRG